MAEFTWTFDVGTNTWKNHALSRKLYEAALEDTVFMEDVRPVEGFGRKMGETVTLTRLSNLTEPTDATLSESERIPEDTYAISSTSITVKELGRALPYTNLATELLFFDLENPLQRALRDQMALILDTKAAAAYKTAKVKYAITGATSNNITTNGTFGAASTSNWAFWHVEEIADYMYDTLHVPPMEDGDYMAIVRTLGLRGLKRDPDWEEWHKYTDPQAKRNGEVGRIEGIRFRKTNHNNALGKVGTGSALGEGVVYGQDNVAMAEVMPPELRAAPGDDFGRSKAVAMYGILEMGIIWDTGNAGEARIVHVGST